MNKRKKQTQIIYKLKCFIVILVMFGIFVAGWLSMSVISVLENTQRIDASNINNLMAQTSEILDSDGNLIEKVRTREYREMVHLTDIPSSLCDAFISVEDERFYVHNGVDPIGISSAMISNISHGRIVRGASTIAQQLARNIYLDDDKTYTRKIKEAYMALQLTEQLGRQGVLEAYMNTVFLGQNAYGVQAAAETYFSKNVKDLTIAESAAIAGIVKSPTNLALYRAILPGDVKDESKVVGDIIIDGTLYKAVWNEKAIERQKYVLEKMLQNEKITKEQYEEALKEDIPSKLKPGIKNIQNLSSYYSALVQKQVVNKLMTELNYSEEAAWNKLITGGLKIYTVVDRHLQQQVEDLYKNFSNVVLKGYGKNVPAMMSWSADKSGNITNSLKHVIFFKKNNLINANGLVFIPQDGYRINEDKSITFLASNNQRVRKVGKYLDPVDYYTVDDNNNLVTHRISAISFPEENIKTDEQGNITINSDFVLKNDDFYTVDENKNLILHSNYYTVDATGVKQPQSSSIIIENGTGYIKAVVGGREPEKDGTINRATNIPRQPGSSIKPLAVYTPALDNGYTTASGIDDVPFYNDAGERWPSNWYNGYKGIVSLRQSVELSINVSAVKVLKDIGIDKSKQYLEKFGIINANNQANDNYISAQENSRNNDENLAAMGLGAMTRGLTNLDMTSAFTALANQGEYIEPITFSKVVDANGDTILDHPQNKRTVVSKQVAYVMTDILRTSTNYMYSVNARKSGFDVAGKTGTTQDHTDLWFVGYTPYYTIGTWIGFDNQQVKLQDNSGEAVSLWAKVNDLALKDKPGKKFEEPDGIVHETVCTISNSLPTKASYQDPRGVVKKEIFVKGTEPKEYDKLHYFREIDTVDGLLATDKTPDSEKGYAVFIKRPIPYDPRKNGNIYPDDWKYTMPGYSKRTQEDYDKDHNNTDHPDNTTPDGGNQNDSNGRNNRNSQNNNR